MVYVAIALFLMCGGSLIALVLLAVGTVRVQKRGLACAVVAIAVIASGLEAIAILAGGIRTELGAAVNAIAALLLIVGLIVQQVRLAAARRLNSREANDGGAASQRGPGEGTDRAGR